VDLARDLIRLSGLVPDEAIKIAFTGLRPGEKLYEELVGAGEEAGPSAVEKILCVRSKRQPDAQLFAEIDALERAAAAGRSDVVIETMKSLIGTLPRVHEATPVTAEPRPLQSVAVADVPCQDEQPCPRCRSGRMHRSHARTLPERIRKDFSMQRLFRCDACGWRGWMEPLQMGRDAPEQSLPVLDLESVDAVISASPAVRRSFAPRNLQ
jgi:hypothetical protein